MRSSHTDSPVSHLLSQSQSQPQPQPHPSPHPHRLPTAIVTGASSGLGRELALQWAQGGARVVALGRDHERLAALAAQHPAIDPVAADLLDLDALPDLARRLLQRHPDIACLVNNAGVQHDRRIDDAGYDADAIRREVAANLVAPMVLTHALMAHLQARPRAWIVQVGSVLGLVPKPTAAVYSATKAGLRLFSDALRVQLRGSQVRVCDVLLPLLDTPMTAGRGHGKLPPEQAARELIDGLRQGREHIRIGQARLVPTLHRWAPGLLARALQRDPQPGGTT